MRREETVDFHIKSAWHAISRMYNQRAAMEGFTTAIGFVLININSKEGTPATKIAPLMGLEARSITRMLKSMEEKGLIFKQPDPIDKRSVRIFLTKEGKKKKEISVQTIKDFNEHVRKFMSEEELQIFFSFFERINFAIDNYQLEKISSDSDTNELYDL